MKRAIRDDMKYLNDGDEDWIQSQWRFPEVGAFGGQVCIRVHAHPACAMFENIYFAN